MRILLCNPKNSQSTKHSRKGMYVPLGILSIATYLRDVFGDALLLDVCDEDVEELQVRGFSHYDVVGFYSTTFNYAQAVRYAYMAKEYDCITILGGPHPTVLAENILRNRNCFDYIIRHEAEYPMAQLIGRLLKRKNHSDLSHIPNLAYKDPDGNIIISRHFHENDLRELPVPSRDFVPFESYVDNFKKIYPEKEGIRPGSIYSSKGCSWRDKTGGCIFCARLEEGVRFRDIAQIWEEIRILQDQYAVNAVWDIADDNLNNKEWFIQFVEKRPEHCKDLRFLIYSRANCIQPWVIDYFHELHVEEVFIGVESGDNRLLKASFKGQTREGSFKALKILHENRIKFYPSFVLGLPGESEKSLENTYNLCRDIAALGGLDRMAATILKPIPGSKAFDSVLSKTRFGQDLARMDGVDLSFLEKYWIDRFTEVSYETIEDYRNKINELMGDYQVFGSAVNESS